MFRESDYVEPQLHPTYTNKPRPILQVEGQISQFDGLTTYAQSNKRATQERPPPSVPVTYDTIMDPSHPDADWTGLVSKERIQQKKHTSEHRCLQSGLVQTEEGIVSRVEKGEWGHLRRNNNVPRGQSELIGGIETENHYQTTSQRQMDGVKTSQDQLTLVKRAGHRKPIQDPAQSTPEIRYSDHSYATAQSNSRDPRSMGSGGGGGANGYSYQPQAIGGSLIKNLGSSLASRIEEPSRSSSSSASQSSQRIDRKTLITENYNTLPGQAFSLIPFPSHFVDMFVGYTGRRHLR